MAAVIALPEKLHGITVEGYDFSGRDLRGKDLSRSIFRQCNFDRANLSNCNCQGSNFTGSSFRKAVLYRTDFKEAVLAATVFEPEDCYGMTITLNCKTFENMTVGQLWWYGWLLFATMMYPVTEPVKGDIRALLIGTIGAERYAKLVQLWRKREY